MGDSAYFPARWDFAHGEGLWKTDGTEAGTLLVKDVNTGPLTLFDGNLFFFSSSLAGLWKSDGTEAGTEVVKTGLSQSSELLAVDGGLLFASTDSDHGNELWRSDGTQSGTVHVQDIFPGPDHSIPSAFTPLGDRVLFLANDGVAGEEPWVAHTAILFGRPDRAIEDLKGEVKLLHLPLGIETSLSAILNAAARDLSAHRIIPAILSLEAFGRHLGALSPGKVSEASAADLQQFTAEIVSLLEDSLKPAIPSER
jgi:ELWxxDGT repeat protein